MSQINDELVKISNKVSEIKNFQDNEGHQNAHLGLSQRQHAKERFAAEHMQRLPQTFGTDMKRYGPRASQLIVVIQNSSYYVRNQLA